MVKKVKTGPSPVIKARITRCRRLMKKHAIGAHLVTGQRDCFYLTGFTGEDSAVILTPKAVHILSDGRFDEAINQECPWVTRWMRRGSLVAEIAKASKELGIKKLAVQPEHMTLADHAELKKLNRATKLAPAPPLTATMRRTKDDSELASIREAIRIAEEAFVAARATIRAGQTERGLAARLEFEMRQRGASAAAFTSICAEGANSALPHAHTGDRPIKRGSVMLVDWGAVVGGYRSDLTRTLFVGTIPPDLGRAYRTVLEAQQRAFAAIRPGARVCDVDAAARNFVREAGFGDAFNHGLGHGLGLDVHEPPSLSWRSTEKLQAGMVVTVEPGVYLPGVGGVRLEDDCLVTQTGCRVLSGLGKSLDDAVL